jgi:hypothetical protein
MKNRRTEHTKQLQENELPKKVFLVCFNNETCQCLQEALFRVSEA